jgi:hypothetical protein
MTISSQTLKEILEAFCMTHWMLDCMTLQMASMIVFVVFKIHKIACKRDFLWQTSGMNIIKKYMLGMILILIVMNGIWIVVISGMTTTFIFYLMTLLHLL